MKISSVVTQNSMMHNDAGGFFKNGPSHIPQT